MSLKNLLVMTTIALFNRDCVKEEINTQNNQPIHISKPFVVDMPSPTDIKEYCFEASDSQKLGLERVSTTPSLYLRDHDSVDAVINGMYYGTDLTPLGVAYSNKTEHANGNRKQTKGYFFINTKGKIAVSEQIQNKNKYAFVIGTYPLLVKSNAVHTQAQKKRYNGREAFRSAIGSKGNNVCFAVSQDLIEMHEWAETLQENGYQNALNLDGGPISELAIRRSDRVYSYGPGLGLTQLVIYSYHTTATEKKEK